MHVPKSIKNPNQKKCAASEIDAQNRNKSRKKLTKKEEKARCRQTFL